MTCPECGQECQTYYFDRRNSLWVLGCEHCIQRVATDSIDHPFCPVSGCPGPNPDYMEWLYFRGGEQIGCERCIGERDAIDYFEEAG